MFDRLTLKLDRVYLNENATARDSTIERFSRSFRNNGRQPPHSMTLQLKSGNVTIFTAVAYRQDSGLWRLGRLAANASKLNWGHNGRPQRSPEDVAMALTRARHFLAPLVTPESVERLIPGVGLDNRGFVHSAELMIQVVDVGHHFLRGSHIAQRPYQHSSSFSQWGAYTKIPGQEISLRFYDKASQWGDAISDPGNHPSTRIEVIFGTAERLFKSVKDSGLIKCRSVGVISTLSWQDAYQVIRHEIGKLHGFGGILNVGSLPCSTTARHILAGLGSHADEAHEVDRALDEYCEAFNPSPKTLRIVSRAVREQCVKRIIPDPLRLLPSDPYDVRFCDVIRPMDERDYRILLRDLNCPMEPDPDIALAWSSTRFQNVKPTGGDLSGVCAPGPLPFLNRCL